VQSLNKFLLSLYFGMSLCAFADLLPYTTARIDVFMKGSQIHNIDKEFAVVSVDGRIKAIGRVSTGSGGTTARRWQVFGIDYYKTSIKFHDAPMPKAISLTAYGDMEQQPIFFHGSDHYNQFDGDPNSRGCIRLMTVDEKGVGVFEDPGLHLVLWKNLNPKGYIPQVNDEGYKRGYLTGDKTSEEIKAYVSEMREKITIYTHRANSLAKKVGWKEAFERLYDSELILSAIDKNEESEVTVRNKRGAVVETKKVRRLIGYQEFDEPLSGTQLDVLSQIE
jgi:hypothetical protein